jgi:predicted transposase/invertase (TIGR01784 family)
MKRDSIFYKLFDQIPGLLFELINQRPPAAENYHFESVEVKETAFRIDGVFLPPANVTPKVVYFVEVQFQKDNNLYYRFFNELFFYLSRNDIYDDWFGVLIFASRSLEPSKFRIHRALLNSDQVQRIYLDELGDVQQQPIGLGLMLLAAIPKTQPDKAVTAAKHLLEQAKQQVVANLSEQAIIDFVTTIMVYKFSHISREEVEKMLGITLEETRAFQQVKQEGREEEAKSLVLRLLRRLLGELPKEILPQIQQLSLEKVETLAESLFDFSTLTDLETWLQNELTDSAES